MGLSDRVSGEFDRFLPVVRPSLHQPALDHRAIQWEVFQPEESEDLVKEKSMPRARVRHILKCWPEFFQPTLNGIKRFELRRDDRPEGFQVGDELLLREWDPNVMPDYCDPVTFKEKEQQAYTGRECLVRVDYILRPDDVPFRPEESFWESPIAAGFVIMSVSLVS
jgi:hypothetical protein